MVGHSTLTEDDSSWIPVGFSSSLILPACIPTMQIPDCAVGMLEPLQRRKSEPSTLNLGHKPIKVGDRPNGYTRLKQVTHSDTKIRQNTDVVVVYGSTRPNARFHSASEQILMDVVHNSIFDTKMIWSLLKLCRAVSNSPFLGIFNRTISPQTRWTRSNSYLCTSSLQGST